MLLRLLWTLLSPARIAVLRIFLVIQSAFLLAIAIPNVIWITIHVRVWNTFRKSRTVELEQYVPSTVHGSISGARRPEGIGMQRRNLHTTHGFHPAEGGM
jgi:hypothetical protein